MLTFVLGDLYYLLLKSLGMSGLIYVLIFFSGRYVGVHGFYTHFHVSSFYGFLINITVFGILKDGCTCLNMILPYLLFIS